LNRPSIFLKLCRRRSLSTVAALLALAVIAVLGVAPPSEGGIDDSMRQLVETYIRNGKQQLDSGLYSEAEKTFRTAHTYQEYLSDAAKLQLQELMEKARIGAVNRKRVDDTLAEANELIKQGQLEAAKSRLEQIWNDEVLTEEEKKVLPEALKQLNDAIRAERTAARSRRAQVPSQPSQREPVDRSKEAAGGAKAKSELIKRQEAVARLYYRSLGYYEMGELEKARDGFSRVIRSGLIPAKMVESLRRDITEIDARLAKRRSAEAKIIDIARPEVPGSGTAGTETPKLETKPAEVPQEAKKLQAEQMPPGQVELTGPERVEVSRGQSSFIDVILRKRNILRSHTKAVVENALRKADEYANKAEFDKAKRAIASALSTVNENEIHLGDVLFKEYTDKLKAKSEEISAAQTAADQQMEEKRRIEAIEAERKLRDEMERDRQRRIAELLDSAKAFAKQGRYEAALDQLDGLLALDPQHDGALTLKDQLEDMVYFRKAREIEKESNRQRADILLETDETGIPYAKEVTYPKNWREIIERPTRKPDEPIGLDPEDMAVYEQLDKVVDLSSLTRTMPLSEAIEVIRNAVDPPLRIVVLWRDLYENGGEIEPTTPINMDGLPAVRLDRADDSDKYGWSSGGSPGNRS